MAEAKNPPNGAMREPNKLRTSEWSCMGRSVTYARSHPNCCRVNFVSFCYSPCFVPATFSLFFFGSIFCGYTLLDKN